MTTVDAVSAVTRRGPVALTVGAAVLSLVLVGLALGAHGLGAPAAVWLALALLALAVRPLAVLAHRWQSRHDQV